MAAIRSQWHESAVVELDLDTKVPASEQLHFLSGKWEMESDRNPAGDSARVGGSGLRFMVYGLGYRFQGLGFKD